MASDEIRKKWGTIYMGNREASLEQLHAMHEPMRREQEKKERAEDYMERVRQRAADRAREILGAAYAERQKVLDEAKAEAAARVRQGIDEGARIKAEADAVKKMAAAELSKAEEIRAEAEKLREAAHDEGFQNGMNQAGAELHEFRAELGQSLSVLLHSIERERKRILEYWREELAALTKAAIQAGTGWILDKEQEALLRNLVFKALNLLENRSAITMRVNPADESAISDLFQAARERAPELKQWIVIGDPSIEPGGLAAETAAGSVDLQRQNFREMVDNVLCHLGLPDQGEDENGASAARELVEREVAHIASLTPELDAPEASSAPMDVSQEEISSENASSMDNSASEASIDSTETEAQAVSAEENEAAAAEADELDLPDASGESLAPESSVDPTLAELEEELFPLEMEEASQNPASENPDKGDPPRGSEAPQAPNNPEVFIEGGFL